MGLDYHQDSVQVCVLDRGGEVLLNRPSPNRWQEIVKRASGCGRVRGVAIESRTGAANLADELVTQAGWSVDLAHPGFVHRMKQNPEKPITVMLVCWRIWNGLAISPRSGWRHRRSATCDSWCDIPSNWPTSDGTSSSASVRSLREQRITRPQMTPWTKGWMAWLRHEHGFTAAVRFVLDEHVSHMEDVLKRLDRIDAELQKLTENDPLVSALLN